ncbi:hypothetical protein DL769_010676 [Monosporascus sp. CRB-8-3]|nr:hypothetical protein DL769_010676 [Monosporascus sp. CRB-8-3]
MKARSIRRLRSSARLGPPLRPELGHVCPVDVPCPGVPRRSGGPRPYVPEMAIPPCGTTRSTPHNDIYGQDAHRLLEHGVVVARLGDPDLLQRVPEDAAGGPGTFASRRYLRV